MGALMSSGKVHDRAILITTPLVAGAVYYFAPNYAAEIAIAHLLGGLWASPDLDTVSRPYKRWGLLKFYWLPYQKASKHRGISHAPIFGTMGRVLYMCPLLLLICYFANINPIALLLSHPFEALAILAGLELSA